MPKNLGVDTFPDPVRHFGVPWQPFWILQAVRRCRRWVSAPFAARLVFQNKTFFLTIFFWQKNCLPQKNVQLKLLLDLKYFWPNKVFWHKEFFSWKIFWTQKRFLTQISFFSSVKMLNLFWTPCIFLVGWPNYHVDIWTIILPSIIFHTINLNKNYNFS